MRAALLLVVILAGPRLGFGEPYWNQFRGPDGNGHTLVKDLPTTFDESKNVKWKTPVEGKAWSSPVVWGKQIWLTNAPPDGKKMYALCFDLESGKLLHNILVFENQKPQYCHSLNSYATPTPVIEKGRLYVHFGVHGTACLDTTTGKILWQRRDLKCNHHRGPASSPIVYGDLLILTFDGFDVQYIAALNKNDGSTVWLKHRAFDYRTNNGDAKKAYCTPIVVKHKGRTQLITPAAVATEAFDPSSGKLLWTVRHGGMNASARPIYGHGLLYITNGMGRMVVVKPDGDGDITQTGIVWQAKKGVPKKSSLLLAGDLLYMVSDSGTASCVDPKTGDVIWSDRLPGGDYAASPLYAKADGRIYFFQYGQGKRCHRGKGVRNQILLKVPDTFLLFFDTIQMRLGAQNKRVIDNGGRGHKARIKFVRS